MSKAPLTEQYLLFLRDQIYSEPERLEDHAEYILDLLGGFCASLEDSLRTLAGPDGPIIDRLREMQESLPLRSH